MKLILVLVCASTAYGVPVNIVDILYRPSGNPPQVAAGTDITITQTAFTNPAGNYYPAFQLTPHPVSDSGGNINLWLEPNVSGQPYTVLYRATNGVITREFWNVPVSATPLKIKDVRTSIGPTPPLGLVQLGQLAQGGAIQGNVITWNDTLKTWEADAPTGGGVTVAQIQTNALVCADDTGSDGSHYVITISPAPAQPLTQYATFCFKPAHNSLSSFPNPSLNVNGSGAKQLLNQSGFALATDDLVAGHTVFVTWSVNLDSWLIINALPSTALQGVDINGVNQVQATHLLGPLPVNQGGTGAATFTAHGPLIGALTGAVVASSPGTSGQCYTSNGASADPTFQACPSGGGGGTDSQSFLLVYGGTGSAEKPMVNDSSNDGFGQVFTGPNSISARAGLLIVSVTDWFYVSKRASSTWSGAAGTVDVTLVESNIDGAPAAGNWNLNFYVGCAASGAAFTYGTVTTVTTVPPSAGYSRFTATGLNLPASCGPGTPMQFWFQRGADTGGVTGVRPGAYMLETVIRGN